MAKRARSPKRTSPLQPEIRWATVDRASGCLNQVLARSDATEEAAKAHTHESERAMRVLVSDARPLRWAIVRGDGTMSVLKKNASRVDAVRSLKLGDKHVVRVYVTVAVD